MLQQPLAHLLGRGYCARPTWGIASLRQTRDFTPGYTLQCSRQGVFGCPGGEGAPFGAIKYIICFPCISMMFRSQHQPGFATEFSIPP
jgi:hypothetical protein